MSENQPRRPLLGLLKDPAFGPYLAGSVLSACGTWIQNIAAAVTMFALTGSATMVASISVVQFAIPVLFAVPVGALADRVDRRRLFRTGRIISGSAVGVLAALLWVGGIDGFGGPPVLLACILATGGGLALSAPARQALIPALVQREQLENAFALNAMIPSIARSAGPAIGAGLLVLGGPALAFTVAAGTHAILVAVLTFIRGREVQLSEDRPRMFGGIRYLVDDRGTALLLLGIGLLGFGGDPAITLTPSLVADFGAPASSVGVLVAWFGVGGGLVPILLPRVRRRMSLRLIASGAFWVCAAGLMTVAVAPTLVAAGVGFALAGSGFLAANVALTTQVQQRVPEDLRGRVMALHGIAWYGSRPVVAFVNGLLADTYSVTVALFVSAVALVLASASTLRRPTS